MVLRTENGRRRRRALLVFGVVMAMLIPAAAFAAAGFDDVADDNIFVADIQWMKDNGITKGCNPPDNTLFCPKDNVTREQMSAFMHRLAVNGVVDAATVEGMTAEELKGQKGDPGDPGPVGFSGADGADGATGPAGAPGAGGTAVMAFQQLDDGYFGSNGLPLGEAASLVTLTFDAPADGVVVLSATVSAESPGLGAGGLMWLQEAGACTYNADENSSAGIYTAKWGAAIGLPDTVSMTAMTPVVAGSNSFDVCASVQFSVATAANQRGVFRHRNLVGTFIANPPAP